MQRLLVMTVIGQDRPGLVESVAALVTEHGGNWLESRMSRLGGHFAGILRVEVPGEKKYLLEEMAPEGLEIIVGAKNDASFGPSIMVGLGGTAAEVLEDRSIRIAPLDLNESLDMLSEMKAARLLNGWRGGPRYDTKTLAELLVKIGQFVMQHPEVREVDLNPVRVYEKGVMVLDALIVCK